MFFWLKIWNTIDLHSYENNQQFLVVAYKLRWGIVMS
jgi:hypothetical protein